MSLANIGDLYEIAAAELPIKKKIDAGGCGKVNGKRERLSA
jgi:hypothetical protein